MEHKKMTIEELVEKMHSIKAEDLKELPGGGFMLGDLPDFSEDCECCEECELAEETYIEVPLSRYDELMSKSTAFDILTSALKRKGEINDDIVWAVTGVEVEPEIEKLKKESSERFNWYWQQKERADKLQNTVKELTKVIEDMQQKPEPDPEVSQGE